jgi:two-component system phosphate regulon response regulator PhoB
MAARVLLIIEETSFAKLLRNNLRAEGFQVATAGCGEDAELAIVEDVPDLVVVDRMLPGRSGIDLCRRIRAGRDTRNTAIVMLSTRHEEGDLICALTAGADHFMVKPWSATELIARAKAILQRTSPARMTNVLSVDDIELNRDERRVTRSGQHILLGSTEFRLLEFMMESANRALSRTQLLDAVWGRDVDVNERVVDVHIVRLRRMLNHGGQRNLIRTVRGVGYALGDKFPDAFGRTSRPHPNGKPTAVGM